ncbi:MAG: hypothetical protein ACE37H_11250 [Phycisphaeraceae bacterium]
MHESRGTTWLSLQLLVLTGVFGLIVSVVPFYGYFAHGGRDQQWYFLVMLGCWLASGVLGLGMVVTAIVWLKKYRAQQVAALGFAVALLTVTGFAWGGLVEGFWELVAG